MSDRTLGIFYDFWSLKNEQGPRGIYWKGLKHKSNPRTRQYMERQLIERFPNAKIYEVVEEDSIPTEIIDSSDCVVLLYPDAIGLGFCKIEHKIQKFKKSILVINGRKRFFNFDGKTKRMLYFRRFLARTMVPEMLFSLIFLFLTPIFLIIDVLRGDC